MQITINSKPDIQDKKGIAAALGTFDGLHIGHRALIDELKKIAGEKGIKTLVHTFTSVPSELFAKSRKPARLFTLEEKIAAFDKLKIDYLVLQDFDKRYADIPEEDFIRRLKEDLNLCSVVVGTNFTYGAHAKGNAEVLLREADVYGFEAYVLNPVMLDDLPVSSTRIRQEISKGDVEYAGVMLGRNYAVSGIVVEGRQIGRSIGSPTVNLRYDKEKLLPKNGVYITRAHFKGVAYPSVTNIGFNPTVAEDKTIRLETHILGFDGKIYGEKVKVEFIKRIRDEIKFRNKEMLKEQIQSDIRAAEQYFKI
jgi:riboflavin kinase/FMN adenylyltransferase